MKKIIIFTLSLFLVIYPFTFNGKLLDPTNLVAKAQTNDEQYIDPDYDPNAVFDPYANEPSSTNTNLDQLTKELDSTSQLLSSEDSKPTLKISGVDAGALENCLDGVNNCKIDRRVVDMLVKISNKHTIKVDRILKNYTTDKKAKTKETDYVALETAPNISAHHDGEAFDISEIDTYQCTIKTPTGKKKTPPKPIKVAWQEKAPGKNIGDPGSQPKLDGSSYLGLGQSLITGAIESALGDQVDISLDPKTFKLNSASVSDIITALGKSALQENFNLDKSLPEGGSLAQTSQTLGQSIVAGQGGLPPVAFQGNTTQDLYENIGRVDLAQKLGLDPSSFQGKTLDSWLASTGGQYLADILDIKSPSITPSRLGNGIVGLAQGKIESVLELKPNVWSENLNTIQNNQGQKLSDALPNPRSFDSQLNITSGSTQKLITGQLNPHDYTQLVSDALKNTLFDHYDNGNRADTALGLKTQGAIKNIVDNNDSLKSIRKVGASVLAKALKLPDDQQSKLLEQVDRGQTNKIDVSLAQADTGLSSEDFIRVFDDSKRQTTLQTQGEKIFNTITKANKPDLYNNYRPSDLGKVIAQNGSINDYITNLGAKSLETSFDLEDGALTNIVKNKKLALSDVRQTLGSNVLNQIAKNLNSELGLKAATINGNDAAQILAGRFTPVLQKVGSQAYDTAIGASLGQSFASLSGKISEKDLFSNAGLRQILKSAGIKAPSDANNTVLAQTIVDNQSSISKNKLELILDSQDNAGYNFNLDQIIKNLGNPGALISDALGLSTEKMAADSSLPSGMILNLIDHPDSSQVISIDAGINYLEKGLGLNNGQIAQFYLSDSKTDGIPFAITKGQIGNNTGIPDSNDSARFLLGDLGGGLKAAGIASYIKEINDKLPNPAALVKYETLAKAAFGAIDYVNVLSNIHGINGDIKFDTQVNNAVRLANDKLSKIANYSILDAQLIKKDSAIPVGFAEKMLTGSNDDRLNILKDYAKAKGGFSDDFLGQKTGLPIISGTSDLLIKGDFSQIADNYKAQGKDFAMQYGFSFADNTFGFPAGSAQNVYSSYQQYQGLQTAYQNGQISSKDLQNSEIALAIGAVDTLTGGALSDATSPIDDALGLPPGSTLRIIGDLLTGNYIDIAFVVVGAVLGFGQVKCPDLQALAREKVAAVLGEIADMSQKDIDAGLANPTVPSQILTCRDEDIKALLPKSEKLYGPGGILGKSGVLKALNCQEIHVGF